MFLIKKSVSLLETVDNNTHIINNNNKRCKEESQPFNEPKILFVCLFACLFVCLFEGTGSSLDKTLSC